MYNPDPLKIPEHIEKVKEKSRSSGYKEGAITAIISVFVLLFIFLLVLRENSTASLDATQTSNLVATLTRSSYVDYVVYLTAYPMPATEVMTYDEYRLLMDVHTAQTENAQSTAIQQANEAATATATWWTPIPSPTPTYTETATNTASPTSTQSPSATPTLVTCYIYIDRSLNIRTSPVIETGNATEVQARTQGYRAIGKSEIDFEGFVWWQIETIDGNLWVRQDIVREEGECSNLPLVLNYEG